MEIFKAKFISYLTKVRRCSYCNVVIENTNLSSFIAKYFCIRGNIKEHTKFLLNLRKVIHRDYKTKKICFEVKCKCKCGKNYTKYFQMNEFKRKTKYFQITTNSLIY